MSVNPASGGTLSIPFAGGTAQLTVPAGAIVAPGNVQIAMTAYGAGSQMGVSFQNAARQAASQHRAIQGVPAGAQFIAGFSLQLLSGIADAPLQVALPAVNPPPAATTLRLAIYNPSPTGTSVPSFFDVDTASLGASGAVITNNVSSSYVSISLVNNTAQLYAFYSVPTANAASPAPITLSASSIPAGPGYAAFASQVTFNAAGADANGNALAYMPTFALSSATLGLLSAGSSPYSTILTTGGVQASGSLAISDPRTGAKGWAQVLIQTNRPANNGDSFTYTGSLSQLVLRNYPSPNPADVTNTAYPSPYPTGVTQTASATSSQAVTVSALPSPGFYNFKTVDTETYALQQTVTTTTNSYSFPTSAGGGNMLLVNANSYDSTTPTDPLAYTINQLYTAAYIVDQLPEVSGASWTNGTAYNYTESDPSGETTTGTWNADGSYTETNVYPTFTSSPSPGATPVTGIITVNSNGSGTYNVPYAVVVSGLSANTVISFGTPAPNPTGTPYIPISIVYYNGANYTTNAPVWYPTGVPMYTETDTNNGPQALPGSCNVPSSIATSGNAIVQKIQRIDPVIGYTDVQTNTTYDVQGFGAVCVTFNDVNTTWYDYSGVSGDQAPFRPRRYYFANQGNPIPVQRTTTTQVLGMTKSSILASSSSRSTQSVALSGYRIVAAKAAFQSKINAIRRQEKAALAKAVSIMLRTPGGP